MRGREWHSDDVMETVKNVDFFNLGCVVTVFGPRWPQDIRTR